MKTYCVPVPPYVLKMLKRDFNYRSHMRVDKMVLCKVYGDHKSRLHFLNTPPDGYVHIRVICRYAGEQKLYTISKTLEYTFKSRMLYYVSGAVDNGHDASESIRMFLDKYDLSLEELEFETARKWWNRHLKREKDRELTPLWV